MKIIFDRIGFSTAGVYLTDVSDKHPGQYHIGYLAELLSGDFEFKYFGIFLTELKDVLPSADQIIEEYKRQYALKGVSVNPDGIVYAG